MIFSIGCMVLVHSGAGLPPMHTQCICKNTCIANPCELDFIVYGEKQGYFPNTSLRPHFSLLPWKKRVCQPGLYRHHMPGVFAWITLYIVFVSDFDDPPRLQIFSPFPLSKDVSHHILGIQLPDRVVVFSCCFFFCFLMMPPFFITVKL